MLTGSAEQDPIGSSDTSLDTGDAITAAFLIGPGRSGTTLLYKLLCLHPGVAFFSNYDTRLPTKLASILMKVWPCGIDCRLQSWFNVAGNAYFVNRPLWKKVVPTPVEGEPLYAACGLPLIPADDYVPDAATAVRLRREFQRICNLRNSSLFLSKRTANNRRISSLTRIFPRARYIYLLRDGRHVARSLEKVEWLDDHVVWWDGRTVKDMQADGIERSNICARNWLEEVKVIEHQLAGVPAGSVMGVRFEELVERPRETLEQILGFLGLEASAAYLAAVDSLQLRPKTMAEQPTWSSAVNSELRTEANGVLARLGYTLAPGDSGSRNPSPPA